MSIEIGNVLRLTMECLAANTTPTDASTVSVTVTDPVGGTTTVTLAGGGVTRDSVGNYHYDYTASLVGKYAYVWTTTGPVAAQSDSIEIVNHALTP